MYAKLKGFLYIIGSRRFAVSLLIVTTSVILVSNLIPSPVLMSSGEAERFIRERPVMYRISGIFHVMNITRSPFFLAIPAFIVLSITVCTYRRIRNRAAAGLISPASGARPNGSGLLKVEDIKGLLESKGWKVGERGEGGFFYAIKGENGIWGSLAFHAGMVIVITGAIVSMLTLFKGKIALTEGFEASPAEQLDKLLDRKEKEEFPYRALLLRSFDARYVEGGRLPLDYTAVIGTLSMDGKAGEEVIKVNMPVRRKGYQFLLDNYYFSPKFIVTEKGNGKVIEDAYIDFQPLKTDLKVKDQFDIPETGTRIIARFYPDFYLDGKIPKTRSMNLENPAFILEFFKGEDKLGDGILPIGKRMDFDDGRYTIEFRDLRKGVIVSVSRDDGLPIVELGLLIVVLGLVVRFILNEKRLWIKVVMQDGVRMVEWGGRANYFPALFDEEMRRLGGDLIIETEDRYEAI